MQDKRPKKSFREQLDEFLEFTGELEINIDREPQADIVDHDQMKYGQDKDYFRINDLPYHIYISRLMEFRKSFLSDKNRTFDGDLEHILTVLKEKRHDVLTRIYAKEPEKTYKKKTYKVLINGGLSEGEYFPTEVVFWSIYQPFHYRAIKEINREKFNILDSLIWVLPLRKEYKNVTSKVFTNLYYDLTKAKVIEASLEDFLGIFNNSDKSLAKVKWLLTVKSGRDTNVRSLCYFLEKLRDQKLISFHVEDYRNFILSHFLKYDGNSFESHALSVAISSFRKAKSKGLYEQMWNGLLEKYPIHPEAGSQLKSDRVGS